MEADPNHFTNQGMTEKPLELQTTKRLELQRAAQKWQKARHVHLQLKPEQSLVVDLVLVPDQLVDGILAVNGTRKSNTASGLENNR